MKNTVIISAILLLISPNFAEARKSEYTFGEKAGEQIPTQTSTQLERLSEQIKILEEIKAKQDETNSLLKELIQVQKDQKESNERVVLKLVEYIKKVEEKKAVIATPEEESPAKE